MKKSQQVLTWLCLTQNAKEMLWEHQLLCVSNGYAMDEVAFTMDGRTARSLQRWKVIEYQRGKPHPSGKKTYRMTVFGMSVYNQGRAYAAWAAAGMKEGLD